MDTLNSPITIKEIQFVIFKLPQKKSIGRGDFTKKFCQILKEDNTSTT